MSPSEFDLRAALREGEGEVPAVHRVIAQAQHRQRERRQRIRSVAVGVSVAAVMVGGFTALALNKPSENAGADGGAAYAPADSGRAPQATSRSAPSAPSGDRPAIGSSPAAADCPAQLPDLALGSGGPGTPDQLFSGSVPSFTSVSVCRYPTGRQSGPADAAVILVGSDGRQLAITLEDGDGATRDCLTSFPYAYTVTARTAHGDDELLVAQPGCHNYAVTNGTDTRYIATDVLDGLFDPPNGPSPNHGSPLK